jgi:hypothetical protein
MKKKIQNKSNKINEKNVIQNHVNTNTMHNDNDVCSFVSKKKHKKLKTILREGKQ